MRKPRLCANTSKQSLCRCSSCKWNWSARGGWAGSQLKKGLWEEMWPGKSTPAMSSSWTTHKAAVLWLWCLWTCGPVRAAGDAPGGFSPPSWYHLRAVPQGGKGIAKFFCDASPWGTPSPVPWHITTKRCWLVSQSTRQTAYAAMPMGLMGYTYMRLLKLPGFRKYTKRIAVKIKQSQQN